MDRDGDTSACDYDFGDENLQALWTEFQRSQKATCPETNAEINLDLRDEPEGGAPTVKIACEKCGRTTEFKPGTIEGFEWAE